MIVDAKRSKMLKGLMVILGVCFVANAAVIPAYARKGKGGQKGGGYNNHVIRSPAAQAAIQAWKELW